MQKSSLSVAAILVIAFLAGCGGSTDRSNPTTGGADGGGSNAGPAPTQTTFVYGTAGESIVGARLASNGQLSALNMPTDEISGNLGWLPGTGGLVTSLAPDPKGRFLYALSVSTSSFGIPIGRNGLSAFTIDHGTGTLTAAPGSPYDVPSRGGNIAVTGDGQRLVLASNGTVTVYAIDQGSGALARISSISTEGNQVVASWDGHLVFVGSSKGRVTSFTIGSDGTLSEINHVDVANAGKLRLSYSDRFLYSAGNSGIAVLAVSSTGEMSVVQQNFSGWQGVAAARSDATIYVSRGATDTTAGAIQPYSADPTTGNIKDALGAPIELANGDTIYDLRTDYSGRYLVVALASGGLVSYPIQQDGTLGAPQLVQGQFVSPQFFVLVP